MIRRRETTQRPKRTSHRLSPSLSFRSDPKTMQQPGNILVMKFGGTSVGSPAAMQQVLSIVHQTSQEWPHQVIVTSALSGITDLLLTSAKSSAEGNTQMAEAAAAEIIRRHEAILNRLIPQAQNRISVRKAISRLVDEFLSLCQEVHHQSYASPRILDSIAGLGERLAAQTLAGVFQAGGLTATAVEATQLIVTDDHFLDAAPDLETTSLKTCRVLEPLLAKGFIPVVTGFIAATRDQIPTTLGRGGSDYSAAILAAALHATETWIWTDVDGVMTADPRLVPEARTIPQLSYYEAAEMASLGAKVLHPKTVLPILEAGGVLRVRNTFNPRHPGTLLVQSNGSNGNGQAHVKAVTVIRGMKWDKLAVEYNPYTDSPLSGVNNSASQHGVKKLVQRGKNVVGETDMVTVICPGLRSSPGLTGLVFNALSQAKIRVLASSFGTSDISMNLFVGSGDTQNTIRTLHGLIQ